MGTGLLVNSKFRITMLKLRIFLSISDYTEMNPVNRSFNISFPNYNVCVFQEIIIKNISALIRIVSVIQNWAKNLSFNFIRKLNVWFETLIFVAES